MAQLAYKARISILGGDSTFNGDIPGNKIGPNIYQIENKLLRYIDIRKEVIEVDPTPGLGVGLKVIDAPNGIIEITFSGQQLVLDETVINFNFWSFMASEILGANSFSVDFTGDILPNTDFKTARENGGYMTKQHGMNDVSITLSKFFDINSSSKMLRTHKENRTKVMIEIVSPSKDESIRGIFLAESINLSGDMSALEMEEYTFQLAGDMAETFSWR